MNVTRYIAHKNINSVIRDYLNITRDDRTTLGDLKAYCLKTNSKFAALSDHEILEEIRKHKRVQSSNELKSVRIKRDGQPDQIKKVRFIILTPYRTFWRIGKDDPEPPESFVNMNSLSEDSNGVLEGEGPTNLSANKAEPSSNPNEPLFRSEEEDEVVTFE